MIWSKFKANSAWTKRISCYNRSSWKLLLGSDKVSNFWPSQQKICKPWKPKSKITNKSAKQPNDFIKSQFKQIIYLTNMGNVSSNEPILSNWNQPNRLANRSGKIIANRKRWSSNQAEKWIAINTLSCRELWFLLFLQCYNALTIFGLIYRITNFLIKLILNNTNQIYILYLIYLIQISKYGFVWAYVAHVRLNRLICWNRYYNQIIGLCGFVGNFQVFGLSFEKLDPIGDEFHYLWNILLIF